MIISQIVSLIASIITFLIIIKETIRQFTRLELHRKYKQERIYITPIYYYEIVYITILFIVAIGLDVLIIIKYPKQFYQYMILMMTAFTIGIILFEIHLLYISLDRLKKNKLNRLVLNHHYPYISVMVIYISFVMVAFKTIMPSVSPVYQQGVIEGNISLLPMYIVQILLVLSIVKVRSHIVFRCKELITQYKLNKVYMYLYGSKNQKP